MPTPTTSLEAGRQAILRHAALITHEECFVWHDISWELETVLLVYLDFLHQVRVAFTEEELEQAGSSPTALLILGDRVRLAVRKELFG